MHTVLTSSCSQRLVLLQPSHRAADSLGRPHQPPLPPRAVSLAPSLHRRRQEGLHSEASELNLLHLSQLSRSVSRAAELEVSAELELTSRPPPLDGFGSSRHSRSSSWTGSSVKPVWLHFCTLLNSYHLFVRSTPAAATAVDVSLRPTATTAATALRRLVWRSAPTATAKHRSLRVDVPATPATAAAELVRPAVARSARHQPARAKHHRTAGAGSQRDRRAGQARGLAYRAEDRVHQGSMGSLQPDMQVPGTFDPSSQATPSAVCQAHPLPRIRRPLPMLQYFFYNLVPPNEAHLYGRPQNARDDAAWFKTQRENPDPST
jgi:hypothetical protein